MRDRHSLDRYKALMILGGPACACCGYAVRDDLDIDHVRGDAAETGFALLRRILNDPEWARRECRVLCVICHRRVTLPEGKCDSGERDGRVHKGVVKITTTEEWPPIPLPIFREQSLYLTHFALILMRTADGLYNYACSDPEIENMGLDAAQKLLAMAKVFLDREQALPKEVASPEETIDFTNRTIALHVKRV